MAERATVKAKRKLPPRQIEFKENKTGQDDNNREPGTDSKTRNEKEEGNQDDGRCYATLVLERTWASIAGPGREYNVVDTKIDGCRLRVVPDGLVFSGRETALSKIPRDPVEGCWEPRYHLYLHALKRRCLNCCIAGTYGPRESPPWSEGWVLYNPIIWMRLPVTKDVADQLKHPSLYESMIPVVKSVFFGDLNEPLARLVRDYAIETINIKLAYSTMCRQLYTPSNKFGSYQVQLRGFQYDCFAARSSETHCPSPKPARIKGRAICNYGVLHQSKQRDPNDKGGDDGYSFDEYGCRKEVSLAEMQYYHEMTVIPCDSQYLPEIQVPRSPAANSDKLDFLTSVYKDSVSMRIQTAGKDLRPVMGFPVRDDDGYAEDPALYILKATFMST